MEIKINISLTNFFLFTQLTNPDNGRGFGSKCSLDHCQAFNTTLLRFVLYQCSNCGLSSFLFSERKFDGPMSKAPEGEGCPRCGGFVYMAEQMLARGRVSFTKFHRSASLL